MDQWSKKTEFNGIASVPCMHLKRKASQMALHEAEAKRGDAQREG
jgi:hypothetical protein